MAELRKQFMAAVSERYPDLPEQERQKHFEAWLANLRKMDVALIKMYREDFKMELRRSGMVLPEGQKEEIFARELRARIEKSAGFERRLEAHQRKARPLFVNGRIVDQYGDPVVDARVEMSTQRLAAIGFLLRQPNLVNEHIVKVTDANGRFKTGNIGGEYMLLKNIEKEGYRYLKEFQPARDFVSKLRPGKNPAYRYVVRDEEDVVEFFLWREEPPFERLVHGNAPHSQPKIGDGPCVMNFFEQRDRQRLKLLDAPPTANSGDVIFEALKAPDAPGGTIMRIRAVKGGIQERPERTFYAPKEGYKKECIVKGMGSFSQTFFVKSRGGQVYALMHVYFQEAHRFTTMDYWANPQGSRNLQPWGPRYSGGYWDALRDRDWTSDDTSDLIEDLALRQREQIKAIEDKLLCQVERKGTYYRGYLGNNRTHYRLKGENQKEPYVGLPLIERRLKHVDVERPETVEYTFTEEPKGVYCSVVRRAEEEILVFTPTGRTNRETRKAASRYQEPSIIWYPYDKEYSDYDIVEIIVPEGPIPRPAETAAE